MHHLKITKNSRSNLFTTRPLPKLSGILYFCIMMLIVVVKIAAKTRKSTDLRSDLINEIKLNLVQFVSAAKLTIMWLS
jgi:hypothetical protein